MTGSIPGPALLIEDRLPILTETSSWTALFPGDHSICAGRIKKTFQGRSQQPINAYYKNQDLSDFRKKPESSEIEYIRVWAAG